MTTPTRTELSLGQRLEMEYRRIGFMSVSVNGDIVEGLPEHPMCWDDVNINEREAKVSRRWVVEEGENGLEFFVEKVRFLK